MSSGRQPDKELCGVIVSLNERIAASSALTSLASNIAGHNDPVSIKRASAWKRCRLALGINKNHWRYIMYIPRPFPSSARTIYSFTLSPSLLTRKIAQLSRKIRALEHQLYARVSRFEPDVPFTVMRRFDL